MRIYIVILIELYNTILRCWSDTDLDRLDPCSGHVKPGSNQAGPKSPALSPQPCPLSHIGLSNSASFQNGPSLGPYQSTWADAFWFGPETAFRRYSRRGMGELLPLHSQKAASRALILLWNLTQCTLQRIRTSSLIQDCGEDCSALCPIVGVACFGSWEWHVFTRRCWTFVLG